MTVYTCGQTEVHLVLDDDNTHVVLKATANCGAHLDGRSIDRLVEELLAVKKKLKTDNVVKLRRY